MKTVRLLAMLEAESVTGPAKNLLQFAQLARTAEADPRVEVSIAVFQRGDSNLFVKTAEQSGVPVYPVRERGRFDRVVVAKLAGLIQEIGPNLLQTHAVKSHFLVRMGGLDKLAPWVAFHHGYTWPDWRARLYNQLDRWSLRAPRQVITMSRPFAAELARQGVAPDRIAIVHNAIDPEWGRRGAPGEAAALRARLGIGPEAKVLLIVGRLSREKDHRTLLEALADIRKTSGVASHLLVVGDGPERGAIEAARDELGLRGAVTLAGQAPSAEPFYGIADVCVLSSLSEGSPNALLEAMAARVPVVATAVGGIPEIVTDRESALLIPPRNRKAMAAALAAVLSDAALARRLTEEAYQRILAHHTPESRLRRLLEIYRGVLPPV